MADSTEAGSVVAQIVTAEAVFVGTIVLPGVPGSAAHFRFLELLNNPRLGASHPGQARETLILTGATILPPTGPAISVPGELQVRPDAIVCAFEYEKHQRAVDPRWYASMVQQKPEPVVMVTVNGIRLEGLLAGGVAALARPQAKRFLPMVNATYAVIDNLATRLHTPFLAVNHQTVIAFSPGVEAQAGS
ncbi:MAG TPA: hypothetical protein VJU18_10570 [Vicinamibacteria bacterium]|nr:hypothetical protein [Vicinamibacteria bacterium]